MENSIKKNKMKNIVILSVIIVLLALSCFLVCFIKNKPENFYKNIIKKALTMQGNNKKIETINTKLDLDININLDEENESEETQLVDLINDIDLSMTSQVDVKNEKMTVTVNPTYKNQNLFNADIFTDLNKEEMYLYVEDFYNKNVKLETEDLEEYFESLKDFFEEINENNSTVLEKKKQKILINTITNKITKENCTKSKEVIVLNEIETKVNKYTYSNTFENYINIFKDIIKELEENNEFIEDDNKLKEELNSLYYDLNEIDTNYDINVEFSFYTTGLKNDILKFEVKLMGDSDIILIGSYERVNENQFTIKIDIDDEGQFEINVEKNDELNTYKISSRIEDLGVIELYINYNIEYNEPIKEMNSNPKILLENITEEEFFEIYSKLMSSKLYELYNEFFVSMQEEYYYEDDYEYDYDYDYDYDYNYIY